MVYLQNFTCRIDTISRMYTCWIGVRILDESPNYLVPDTSNFPLVFPPRVLYTGNLALSSSGNFDKNINNPLLWIDEKPIMFPPPIKHLSNS